MKKQGKKKFQLPTEANMDGEINVSTGIKGNNPPNSEKRFPGDSVEEHNHLEDANEIIAKKEISQVYNNS